MADGNKHLITLINKKYKHDTVRLKQIIDRRSKTIK